MKENENHLMIDMEVKTMRDGQLIDSIAASAKLSKADAGKVGNVKESITASLDPCHYVEPGCGCPKMTVTYTTETNQ